MVNPRDYKPKSCLTNPVLDKEVMSYQLINCSLPFNSAIRYHKFFWGRENYHKKNAFQKDAYPVADPTKGGGRPPDQNFLNFMQFFGKIWQICMLEPPTRNPGSAPCPPHWLPYGGGVFVQGGLPNRDPLDRDPPWTKIPLDRDPLPHHTHTPETPLGQRPPPTHTKRPETSLGQRPLRGDPPHRDPPWTETPLGQRPPLDRDPLDRHPPPGHDLWCMLGQRPASREQNPNRN